MRTASGKNSVIVVIIVIEQSNGNVPLYRFEMSPPLSQELLGISDEQTNSYGFYEDMSHRSRKSRTRTSQLCPKSQRCHKFKRALLICWFFRHLIWFFVILAVNFPKTFWTRQQMRESPDRVSFLGSLVDIFEFMAFVICMIT